MILFIREVNRYEGRGISKQDIKNIVKNTVEKTRGVYRKAGRIEIKEDLNPDTYLTLSDKKNKIEESIVKLENKQKTINDIKNRIKSNLKERRELILKSFGYFSSNSRIWSI